MECHPNDKTGPDCLQRRVGKGLNILPVFAFFVIDRLSMTRTDKICVYERIFQFLCFFMLDRVQIESLNWAKKVSWWGSKSKGFG